MKRNAKKNWKKRRRGVSNKIMVTVPKMDGSSVRVIRINGG